MTLADVPKGMGPEAFLNDAQLAELYEREFAALAEDDPNRDEIRSKRNRARQAAAMTAAMTEEAQARAESAIAKEAKGKK
jgi:hypothetical protein